MGFNPDYEVVFGPDGKIIASQLPAFPIGDTSGSALPADAALLRLPPFVVGRWYESQFKGSTFTTFAPVLNQVYYDLIYVPNAITASTLATRTTTTAASAVLNAGIYSADTTTGVPAARLASGTIAAPAAALYQVTGLNLTLARGFYYFACLLTGATTSIAVASGGSPLPTRGETAPIPSAGTGPLSGYVQSGQTSLPATATPVAASETQQARPRLSMLAA